MTEFAKELGNLRIDRERQNRSLYFKSIEEAKLQKRLDYQTEHLRSNLAGELEFGLSPGFFSNSWTYTRKYAIVSNIGLLIFEVGQYAEVPMGIKETIFPLNLITCVEENTDNMMLIVGWDNYSKKKLFGLRFD